MKQSSKECEEYRIEDRFGSNWGRQKGCEGMAKS
jgi:hypothetical protein